MKNIFFAMVAFLPLCLYAQKPDSIAVAREVDHLIQECQTFIDQHNFDQALQVIKIAKDKAEAGLGKMSAGYANCAHIYAVIYIKMGKFKEAEPFCIMARDIRKKVLGTEHPDYSLSLSYLATLYKELGQYDKSESLALEVKEIRAKNPGKESSEYAITLHLLGMVYYKLGQYEKSESYYLEAKNIFAKTLGNESPEYAINLANLAALYNDFGKYEKVEELYLESKANQEKSPGKASVDYASTLNNLALFYFETGQYFKAKQFFIEANQVFAIVFGKDHEYYVATLTNLASLYYEIGQYGKAELLFLEAKDILEKTVGKDNHSYAVNLLNLGALYFDIGQYDKVESIYQEAIHILEKVLGKSHPDYATSLANLGNLYYKNRKYADAEVLLEEAKNIRQKVLGNYHPDYATSLNNLAELYSNSRQYAKAEPLFLEARGIWAKTLGVSHHLYAESLQNLAQMYAMKGDFGKADSLFLEAKGIFAETLGKDHPNYAAVLNSLALLYRSTNRISESAPLFLELNGIIRSLIERSASYFSEKEMLSYLQTYEEDLAQFHSFCQINPTPEFICGSFDNTLFYNGYLLENARRIDRFVGKADSLTRDTFDRWQGCKRRLASEYAKPITERRYITELEAEAEAYEKTLTRNLPVFGETRQVPHWQDVRDHLHNREAAIEFIHYRYYNPEETDSTIYAALVLLAGDTCPHLIPLCEQQQLNNLLHEKYPDKRYQYTISGNSLYSLLWKPIEPLLKDISIVYYAPSGALHSVNLDAIMLNLRGDSALIDKYKLVRLGSTRQLVAPVTAKIAGNEALLFGGIRYESDSTAIQYENRINGVVIRGSDEESLPEYIDSVRQIPPLAPLPSTLEEVRFIRQQLIQKNFNVQVFTGFGASEELFKQRAGSLSASGSSPRVIHLATHGYFFSAPKSMAKEGKGKFGDEPAYRISEHPYLRSGLVLAGGNHAWQTGKPFKKGMEDGILTAYEISGMSLPNTELAVLSACETGLGDVTGNEGVYGLQRAFKIAGVQYLIMSLWRVPDVATKDLMNLFYSKWLDEKMDIPGAFRAAQLEMKKKDNDPEKWAGFVLMQ